MPPAHKPSNIDPDKMYTVKVIRAVPMDLSGRVFMTPHSENVVRGRALADIPDDAIESVVEVEA